MEMRTIVEEKKNVCIECIFYSSKANESYRKCAVEYMNTISLC